jgi:hypothetical protein
VRGLSAAEEYIAAAVLQKPALLHTLPGSFHFDDQADVHPQLRAILEGARSMEESGGYPLHLLDSRAQATAARLLLKVLPELDDPGDERINAGVHDAIRRLQETSVLTAIADLRRSTAPDPEELNRHISELARLRRG